MATRSKAPIVILGGGLSGLVSAALLERAGLDYHLVEASTELGGFITGLNEHGTCLDYGPKSVPAGDDLSENPLIKLKNILNLNCPIESWTEPAKTYEDKGFIDFVGFGETKNRALVEELSYYVRSPRLMVSGGWQNLVNELVAIVPEKRRWMSAHVTKLEVQDDMVIAAHVNGDTKIAAQNFICTLSPAVLNQILPHGAVSPKLLQRVAKTTPLTAISLDIATKTKISNAKNVFVMKDTPKDEDPLYVIGYYVTNVDPHRQSTGAQISTWMTLVNPEEMEDDENASKHIRTMKKLIKKAFPTLIESKIWERLLVVPQAIAEFDQLTLEKNGTLPGLTNFWITGGHIQSESRNTGAAIETAMRAAQAITAMRVTQPTDGVAQEDIPQENAGAPAS